MPTLLISEDWRKRYGGLIALAVSAECCKTPLLCYFLPLVLPLLDDPEPRVRWAVCRNFISAKALRFTGIGCVRCPLDDTAEWRKRRLAAESTLVAALPVSGTAAPLPEGSRALLASFGVLLRLVHDPVGRVGAAAAAGLAACLDAAPDSTGNALTASIFNAVFPLLGEGQHTETRCAALDSVAALARCVGAGFAPFYEAVTRLLCCTVAAQVHPEPWVVKVKAIECFAAVCMH